MRREDDKLELMVVSYATAGPYEQEAARLRASCSSLSLPLSQLVLPAPVGEDSNARWLEAVGRKPSVLLAFRDLFPRHALLYVDADAVLLADPRPALAELPLLFGAHRFPDGSFMSGTLWIPPVKSADRILVEWERLQRTEPDRTTPQRLLDTVLSCSSLANGAVILPPELCWIDDTSPEHFGHDVSPIVEHLQASREFRFDDRENSRLPARRERIAALENGNGVAQEEELIATVEDG